MPQACLAVWSVCLKWNILPSRLPETSVNTKKNSSCISGFINENVEALALISGWSLMAECRLRMLKALGSDTNASNNDDGDVDEIN